eukprot:GHVN01069092.1.p1 GENE.GHVN01069092.1~~GHVN01069092.1.p1  ORF type:complete len:1302 (+),score=254.42 GHVN01069092.1:149-4054(+)
MLNSSLWIKCVESTASGTEGSHSPTSSEEALDAAVIAAVSTQLPNLVAAHADGASEVALTISTSATKVTVEEVIGGGKDDDVEEHDAVNFREDLGGHTQYPLVTDFTGMDVQDVIGALEENLLEVCRQNQLMMDEKQLLLRRRELEEEQRAGWINTLQGRIAETLKAKDGIARAKDELLTARQNQHAKDVKDMQTRIASALRQRDEALVDSVSTSESRMREANRYQDEVDRLQDEIGDRLLSGDGNVGEYLNQLHREYQGQVAALQGELKKIKDKNKKDEKYYQTHMKELENRMRGVDGQKARLEHALGAALRDVNRMEKEKTSLHRKLENQEISCKRDRDELMRIQKESESLRRQRADAMREAAVGQRYAGEADALRQDLEDAALRLLQMEADAREERLRLKEELQEAKKRMNDLSNENSTRVQDNTYRQLQNELNLMRRRTEDNRKKHDQAITSLQKGHEVANKKLSKQLNEARTGKDLAMTKFNEETFQLMMERDNIRNALKEERDQIADLEDDLTQLTENVQGYQRGWRLQVERDRMDKIRQMASMKQSLDAVAEKHRVQEKALDDQIQAMRCDAELVIKHAKDSLYALQSENDGLRNTTTDLEKTLESLQDDLRERRQQADEEARLRIFSEAEGQRRLMEIESLNQMLKLEREAHEKTRAMMRKEIEEMQLDHARNHRMKHIKTEMEKTFAGMMAAEAEKILALENTILDLDREASKVESLKEELMSEKMRVTELEVQIAQGTGETSDAKGKSKAKAKKSSAAADARVIALERKIDELKKVAPPSLAALATDNYAKKLEGQLEDAQKKLVFAKKKEVALNQEIQEVRNRLAENSKTIEELGIALEAKKKETEELEDEKDAALREVLNTKRALRTALTSRSTNTVVGFEDGSDKDPTNAIPKMERSATVGVSSSLMDSKAIDKLSHSKGSKDGKSLARAKSREETAAIEEILDKEIAAIPAVVMDDAEVQTEPGEGEKADISLNDQVDILKHDLKNKIALLASLRATLQQEEDKTKVAIEDLRSFKDLYTKQRENDAADLKRFHHAEEALRQKTKQLQEENNQLLKSQNTYQQQRQLDRVVRESDREKELDKREIRLSGLSDERRVLRRKVNELNLKISELERSASLSSAELENMRRQKIEAPAPYQEPTKGHRPEKTDSNVLPQNPNQWMASLPYHHPTVSANSVTRTTSLAPYHHSTQASAQQSSVTRTTTATAYYHTPQPSLQQSSVSRTATPAPYHPPNVARSQTHAPRRIIPNWAPIQRAGGPAPHDGASGFYPYLVQIKNSHIPHHATVGA